MVVVFGTFVCLLKEIKINGVNNYYHALNEIVRSY